MSENGDQAQKENPDANPDRQDRPLRLAFSPKGGAPLVPGNPGNRGGRKGRSGRRRDEMIERLARMLDRKGIPLLEKIIEGKVEGDQQRAVELVMRYVLGQRADVAYLADVQRRLQETIDTARAVLPEELAQAFLDRARQHWRLRPPPR